MTGGPGKEQGTNKPPPTRRVRERSKGNTSCPSTSQNPSLWHPSWLNKACTTRKDSESEWLAKDNPETNPITIKPKTASHVTEQFSWVPLPFCSPPGRPFPIKSLALSAHVSPRTLHFWVLDKSPVSGPGRGPLSYNTVSLSKAMLGFFTMLVTRILDHSSMDQIWNMLLSWCLKECDVNYSDEISVMAPLVTQTCDWSLS